MAAPSPARPRSRDHGFTLVEVVVAFALFAVMSTALLSVVVTTQKLTREDAARAVANNLASRELEIARDTFSAVRRGPAQVATNRVANPSPLPGGTVGQPLVVDGVRYQVVREAQWASVGNTASTCDDGSNAELAYLKVEVSVSWPELGSRPPVRMETVMTPIKGTYTATSGHIGLKVIDRLGQPRAGVAVTVTKSGQSRTAQTTGDGCVLFSFLDPGTYTVALAAAGEVDPAGQPTASRTVTVQAGQLWRGTQEYDKAASIGVTLTAPQGFALPAELAKVPVTLGNSALLPGGRRAVAGSGATRTLTNLWPYPSGYEVWAGGCADADPGDAGEPPVAVGPGVTTAAQVVLPALAVTTPGPNQQVVATHAADAVCATAVSMGLGTSSGTELRTSLPYGTWTLSRPGSTAGTTVTVGPAIAPDDASGQASPTEPTRVTVP